MVELRSNEFASDTYLEAGGVVIPVDPAVITPPIRAAILAGRFEAEEGTQIPHIVRPGDRVLEIGAGIGYISTLLSRQRRVSSVLAVEANPHLIEYMARLHARNNVRKVRRLTQEAQAIEASRLECQAWAPPQVPPPIQLRTAGLSESPPAFCARQYPFIRSCARASCQEYRAAVFVLRERDRENAQVTTSDLPDAHADHPH